MSIERLKELSAIRERNRDHPAVDALIEEAIDEVFDGLPKLLAVVDAVGNLFENRLVEDSPEMGALYEAYKAAVEETK